MSDLISRSALLKNYGLANAVKYGNKTEEQQHNSYSTMMLYEIADMIMDAPTIDAMPKWISVKDKLPDDLEEVLILVKETEFYGQYKEFSKSYYCQYIGCVDDGEWFTVWCHGHRYIKDTAKEPYADKFEVTHWMPLPELPKGDE